jgi:hypothetical protein
MSAECNVVMTLGIIKVYDGLCFVRFGQVSPVFRPPFPGMMRITDQNPPPHHTIFDRELGQDWFQDGRKLPNIFKTRGDVS